MTLTVELTQEQADLLRRSVDGDLDAFVREALGVQLFRERKLTHGQLKQFLGVSSYETDAIIKKHGGVDETTAEELEAQLDAVAALQNRHSPGN